MNRHLLFMGFFTAVSLLSACSTREIVADAMADVLEETEAALLDEPSYRYGRESGPGLLKLLDSLIIASPENRRLLILGNRLGAQFAFGFVENEDTEFARSLYDRASDYGLRALASNELTAATRIGAAETRAALASVPVRDVATLFWTGAALAGSINTRRDSIRAVADLPIAVAFMDRVIELDPTYFHGGAYLFLGQYEGSRGRELGGSPERAQKALERAFAISQDRLLLARVWQARFVAIPTQDAASFVTLLNEVLDADDDILENERLLTAVAKHHAARLLEEIDDHFLEPPEAADR